MQVRVLPGSLYGALAPHTSFVKKLEVHILLDAVLAWQCSAGGSTSIVKQCITNDGGRIRHSNALDQNGLGNIVARRRGRVSDRELLPLGTNASSDHSKEFAQAFQGTF